MTPAARDVTTALTAITLKQATNEREPLDPHTRDLLRAAMRQHPELAKALTQEQENS